jgi:hypothetical protein
MAIETAIVFGVALALPVWLGVQEILHRQIRRMVKTRREAAPSTVRVPAPRAA